MMAKILFLMACLTFLNSCIVPVPHRRVHIHGAKGQVLDSRTSDPIAWAKIQRRSGDDVMAVTDIEGKYERKPVYGWHGAYMFGPVSYSLLPHFDMAYSIPDYWVSAVGYTRKRITDKGITRLDPILRKQ